MVLCRRLLLAIMAGGHFEQLKNPSSWRRIAIASWNPPNDPTVYFSFPIEFSRAKKFLEKCNASSGIKITPTHLVSKAVALTLRHYPELNGIIKWRRIYLRKTVDIFLQVAIAEGDAGGHPDLSGAKIAACDTKNLSQIAAELSKKSAAIRAGKDPQFRTTLRMLNRIPALLLAWGLRLTGFLIFNLGLNLPRLGLPADPFGSAMVTSVGSLGIPSGFAPLSPPSRVPIIVCVGAVTDRPWVVDGQVMVRPILDLSISFDHRFIDGLSGARMAEYFQSLIDNPGDKLF